MSFISTENEAPITLLAIKAWFVWKEWRFIDTTTSALYHKTYLHMYWQHKNPLLQQQQQQSLQPKATRVERKPSVKRQVSWGPPTVAEADAETLKLTITAPVYKQNGYYGSGNTTNNKNNTNCASMTWNWKTQQQNIHKDIK